MKLKTLGALLVAGIIGFGGAAQADITSGLVAYYPFDGDATDASGNGNHGTVNGNIQYVDGRNDKAIYLDNPRGSSRITQWVDIPYTESIQGLEDSSFTISVCITSTDDTQRNGRLFGNSINSTGIFIDYNAGSQSNAYGGVGDVAGTFNYLSDDLSDPSSAIVTDGEFHCVSLVLDRTNGLLKEYVDNSLVDSVSVAIDDISFQNLVLGASKLSDTYGARLTSVDELRIYNRALSESEIQELYTGSSCSSDGFTQDDLDAQYEAGKQYCINNPTSCGISSGSGSPATVGANLNIHIPSATFGSSNIWVDLEYVGASGFDHIWKLSDYDYNQ